MEIAYNCDSRLQEVSRGVKVLRFIHYLVFGSLSDCSGIKGRRLSFSCWDVAIKKMG